MAALNLGELLLTLGIDSATLKRDSASAQKSISAIEKDLEKTGAAADKVGAALTGAGSKSAKASATAEKASAAATAAAVKAQAAQEKAAKATADAAEKAGTKQERASAKAAATAEKDAKRTAEAAEKAYAKATAAAEKSAASQAKAIEKVSIAAKFEKIGESFDRIGSKMQAAGATLSAALTLPIIGAGIAIGKTAMNYESAFAGVRKTVDATEEQFKELSEGIREMSLEMPASAVSIANVAEAAGQLGIKTQAILGFSDTMVKLGTTTNLSATDAATALARLANITQMPQTEFERLGSTVVALGNNLATTESEIVQMVLRLAGAGKTVGMTEAQILSFGGALSSVGIEAEAGGTAFSRVMVNIENEVKSAGENLGLFAAVAGMSAEEFGKAWETDASGALVSFIEGLGKIQKSGQNVFPILDQLELGEIRVRDALIRASGAGDLFRKSLVIGSKAWEENNALNKEAAERNKTTESRLQMVKNAVTEVGITLGESMLPAIQNVLGAMKPWLDSLKEAAERFNDLDDATQASYVRIGLIAAVIGPASILFGTLAKVIGYVYTAASNLGVALTFLSAHPFVALGVALAALVLGGVVVAKGMRDQKEEAEREGRALYDLTKEYDKLTKAIDSEKLSEEERLKAGEDQKDLIEEIGALFPNLITQWDEHGKAVALNTEEMLKNNQAVRDNNRLKAQGIYDQIAASEKRITELQASKKLATENPIIKHTAVFGAEKNPLLDVARSFDAKIAAERQKIDRLKAGLQDLSHTMYGADSTTDTGYLDSGVPRAVKPGGSGGSDGSDDSDGQTDEERRRAELIAKALADAAAKKTSADAEKAANEAARKAEEARRQELEKTAFQLDELDDGWRLYQITTEDATDSAEYQAKRTEYQAARLEILKQRLADVTAQYDLVAAAGESVDETRFLARTISQTNLELAETKNPTFATTAKEKKDDEGAKALKKTAYQLDQLDAAWQTYRTQRGEAGEDADFLAKREEYLAERLGISNQRLADASAQYEVSKKSLGEFADETMALGQIIAQTNQEIAETGTADFGKSKSKAFLDEFETAYKQSQDAMLDKFKENQDEATAKMKTALGEQRDEQKADHERRAKELDDQLAQSDNEPDKVKNRHTGETEQFKENRKKQLEVEEDYLYNRRKLYEADRREDERKFAEDRRKEAEDFGDALDEQRDKKRKSLAREIQDLRDAQTEELNVIRKRYDGEAALRDANLAAKIAPFKAGLDALRKQEEDEAQLQKIADMEREVRDAREGIDKAFASNSMEQIAEARKNLADVLARQEAEITKDRRRAEMDRLQASIDAATAEATVADNAAKVALATELDSKRDVQEVAMTAAEEASTEKWKDFEKELRKEINAENSRVEALRTIFQTEQADLRESERKKLKSRAEAFGELLEQDKTQHETRQAAELERAIADQEKLRQNLRDKFAEEDKALEDRQVEFEKQWEKDQEAQGKRYAKELQALKDSLKDKTKEQQDFLNNWPTMESKMSDLAPEIQQAPLTKTQADKDTASLNLVSSLVQQGRTAEAQKTLEDTIGLTPEQAIKNIEAMLKTLFDVPGGGGGGSNGFFMAEGGITTGPVNATIGEAGQEAVIPIEQLWSKMADYVQSLGDRMLAQSGFSDTVARMSAMFGGSAGGMPDGGQAALAGVAGSNIDVNVYIGNRQIDDLWVESKDRNTKRGRA